MSFAVFERQMKYLYDNKFKTVTLIDVINSNIGKRPLSGKEIVLTFDDGYLDNWVFVYPILKKYGLKATIFVNPEFVDPTPTIRPTYEDVLQGKIQLEGLQWWGYLSWEEIKVLVSSGLVDIQSHGLTHNWHFTGNKIVDYHHPNDSYFWNKWNCNPEMKPFWLNTNIEKESNYGSPIYEHGRGFIVRRYFEDNTFTEYLKSYVNSHGGKSFFEQDDWRQTLDQVTSDYLKSHSLQDANETDEEYLERVKYEMSESRRLIEMHTGKPVQFLCWPNGGYNEQVHRLATEELGYAGTVIVDEHTDLSMYSNLLPRVSFGEHYQGFLSGWVHFLKFVSAVESRSGTGVRHDLILCYQRVKKIIKKSLGKS